MRIRYEMYHLVPDMDATEELMKIPPAYAGSSDKRAGAFCASNALVTTFILFIIFLEVW